MQESSQWLLRYRRFVALSVHAALFALAQAFAFGLRFEFSIPDAYFPLFWVWLAGNLATRLVVFGSFGLFSGMWRYTGARDLEALLKATALSTLVFAVFIVLGGYRSFPRSILIIDFLLTMILVGGLRFGVRSLWQLTFGRVCHRLEHRCSLGGRCATASCSGAAIATRSA
jgi:FlaA1/EpsC-like NDP-sugar epimerase